MWTTFPGTLRPFNWFLILLNLGKDLSPEQLVTIKLRNKASRLHKLRTTNLRRQTQTRFCHIIAVSLSRLGRVLRLPVGKVGFALYLSSSRSSLIFLAWGSTNVRKYSIAIWFLNDFTEENSNVKKSHPKIPIEIQTLTKLVYCSVT